MMTLEVLREKIDSIDTRLVKLLNDRTRQALKIGKLKQKSGKGIYVPAREKAVFARVVSSNEGPLSDKSLRVIYREIMSAALSLEKKLKVAYLGPPSTFSHQAARSRFGGSVDYLSCETISDVFDSVEKETADYGVVPVENSTEGAVTFTLDRLAETSLKICAELYLPISNSLLARVPRERIKKLYSHPQVLGQCRQWLQREMSGVEIIPVASTARAAELAAHEKNAGALSSQLAAEIYGLDTLESDVQDLSGNTTRFLVIGHDQNTPSGDDKTSLIFAVQHRAGALYGALESFKKFGLNMTKIESRPSRSKRWEYYFFVDVAGHAEDVRVKKAMADIARHCAMITILGSYPVAAGK
jgi:chorismate mutase/prephenate dehydratase